MSSSVFDLVPDILSVALSSEEDELSVDAGVRDLDRDFLIELERAWDLCGLEVLRLGPSVDFLFFLEYRL